MIGPSTQSSPCARRVLRRSRVRDWNFLRAAYFDLGPVAPMSDWRPASQNALLIVRLTRCVSALQAELPTNVPTLVEL